MDPARPFDGASRESAAVACFMAELDPIVGALEHHRVCPRDLSGSGDGDIQHRGIGETLRRALYPAVFSPEGRDDRVSQHTSCTGWVVHFMAMVSFVEVHIVLGHADCQRGRLPDEACEEGDTR